MQSTDACVFDAQAVDLSVFGAKESLLHAFLTRRHVDARVFDAKARNLTRNPSNLQEIPFRNRETRNLRKPSNLQEIHSKKSKTTYTCNIHACASKNAAAVDCIVLKKHKNVPIVLYSCSILQPGLLGVDNSLRIMLPTAK
jgi:hypothetical protein